MYVLIFHSSFLKTQADTVPNVPHNTAGTTPQTASLF